MQMQKICSNSEKVCFIDVSFMFLLEYIMYVCVLLELIKNIPSIFSLHSSVVASVYKYFPEHKESIASMLT